MSENEYRFVVRGLPQPKGSMRGFPFRGKDGRQRVALTATNPQSKNWATAISQVLQDFPEMPWMEPVAVRLTFYLPRPKSAPKRVVLPATRPDIDKIARLALDAMTQIVFHDDAQVVDLIVQKRFATEFVGLEGMVWKRLPVVSAAAQAGMEFDGS